ncbi:MAG TPA: hypothetical protein VGH44_05860 [Candidatus Saccharimonadia bacterium]
MSTTTNAGPGPIGSAMLDFIEALARDDRPVIDQSKSEVVRLMSIKIEQLVDQRGMSITEARRDVFRNVQRQVIQFAPNAEIADKAAAMFNALRPRDETAREQARRLRISQVKYPSGYRTAKRMRALAQTGDRP